MYARRLVYLESEEKDTKLESIFSSTLGNRELAKQWQDLFFHSLQFSQYRLEFGTVEWCVQRLSHWSSANYQSTIDISTCVVAKRKTDQNPPSIYILEKSKKKSKSWLTYCQAWKREEARRLMNSESGLDVTQIIGLLSDFLCCFSCWNCWKPKKDKKSVHEDLRTLRVFFVWVILTASGSQNTQRLPALP